MKSGIFIAFLCAVAVVAGDDKSKVRVARQVGGFGGLGYGGANSQLQSRLQGISSGYGYGYNNAVGLSGLGQGTLGGVNIGLGAAAAGGGYGAGISPYGMGNLLPYGAGVLPYPGGAALGALGGVRPIPALAAGLPIALARSNGGPSATAAMAPVATAAAVPIATTNMNTMPMQQNAGYSAQAPNMAYGRSLEGVPTGNPSGFAEGQQRLPANFFPARS